MSSDETFNEVDEARLELVESIREELEREPISRNDYIYALAFMTLLLKPMIGEKAANRLLDLAVELYDLNLGRVGRLVEPTAVGKRPPDPSLEWMKRAQDALALECLIRSGDEPETAARSIARARAYEYAKVINWRNELRARRVTSPLAQIVFASGLGRIEALSTDELVNWQRNILKTRHLEPRSSGFVGTPPFFTNVLVAFRSPSLGELRDGELSIPCARPTS